MNYYVLERNQFEKNKKIKHTCSIIMTQFELTIKKLSYYILIEANQYGFNYLSTGTLCDTRVECTDASCMEKAAVNHGPKGPERIKAAREKIVSYQFNITLPEK